MDFLSRWHGLGAGVHGFRSRTNQKIFMFVKVVATPKGARRNFLALCIFFNKFFNRNSPYDFKQEPGVSRA